MTVMVDIEIPKNSHYKYEVCKKTGQLILDRPLSIPIPHNYGYVKETLCDDGDPLDAFVITKHPVPVLTQVKAKLIGVIDGKDTGKKDPKLLLTLEGEEWGKDELKAEIGKVYSYLLNYKKTYLPSKPFGLPKAKKILEESIRWFAANESYEKYSGLVE